MSNLTDERKCCYSGSGQAGRAHHGRRGADVLPASDLPTDTGDDAQVQYKEGNYSSP